MIKSTTKYGATRAVSIASILFVSAVFFFGHAFWIQAKAQVGQVLLESAWQRTLSSNEPQKAWPWADTWPVAQLRVPSMNKTLIVLEGVSGEAMAFGPGRIPALSNSAANGVYGIGGHRDSHLQFLEAAEKGIEFHLTSSDGKEALYEVSAMFVADSATHDLELEVGQHGLVLITCYPFNALQTGGSKRFVVVAKPVS